MQRRKSWWAVSVFLYSFPVQLFYYLAIVGIVFLVPAVRMVQFVPFQLDGNFFTALGILIAILFCGWRFSVGARKEYVEKNLG